MELGRQERQILADYAAGASANQIAHDRKMRLNEVRATLRHCAMQIRQPSKSDELASHLDELRSEFNQQQRLSARTLTHHAEVSNDLLDRVRRLGEQNEAQSHAIRRLQERIAQLAGEDDDLLADLENDLHSEVESVKVKG